MSITPADRESILDLFPPEITTREQIEKTLPTEIFVLLKSKDNLRTVSDKVLFFNRNRYRTYDSAHITNILSPNFNCSKAIISLVEELTPPYLIFLDFHFCFEITQKQEDSSNKIELKFQRASKPSSFNKTFKISTTKDLEDLSSELRSKNEADLLNTVFVTHTELYEYGSSGFRPYQLVALSAIIQKYPK